MTFIRPRLSSTADLKSPTEYAAAISGEFRDYAFDEERISNYRGRWRQDVFHCSGGCAVDLEIGTGNGLHFFDRAKSYPGRKIVGIELKYKPLIQSIRRATRAGLTNARIGRAHAFNLDLIFGNNELDDVFVHFPDPWTSPRKPQNRILNPRLLDILWACQRPNSVVEFKTDSREAFRWSIENVRNSAYQIDLLSENLAAEIEAVEKATGRKSVQTQFERIFNQQGRQIYYALFRRPDTNRLLVEKLQ